MRRLVTGERAPEKAGEYPLVGFFLYGTEKATSLGTVPNPMYGDQPLGGYTGKSLEAAFTRLRLDDPVPPCPWKESL